MGVLGKTFVAVVVETCSESAISDTAGTTDTMDVFVDVVGEVIVDDMHDILDIETPGSDVCSNENGCFAIAESNHCILQHQRMFCNRCGVGKVG